MFFPDSTDIPAGAKMIKIWRQQTHMKLVICDDDPKDLHELESLLVKYSDRRPSVCFDIEMFSDASALLHKLQHKDTADIYILDIIMSQLTGIDLGNEIRKNNSQSIIIYVTTSEVFAMDAYNIHALRYLLKPIKEEKFFEALDYTLFRMDTKKECIFLVKTKAGLESIPYSQIEYIENSSRKLKIHLTDGETVTSIYIRESFEKETSELVNSENFIYVHKSFLINMNHVKTLFPNTLVMDSGISIPISKKNSPDVKRKYLMFISSQYK